MTFAPRTCDTKAQMFSAADRMRLLALDIVASAQGERQPVRSRLHRPAVRSMADPTILLMTAPRPFDDLGDDERILIGGMQERGFQVERLQTRTIGIMSYTVPTRAEADELTRVRAQLRLASWRLNWSTGVVTFFGLCDVVSSVSQRRYVTAATYAMLIVAALLYRFVLAPRSLEVR